ncbi:response regulator [Epilithonimonas lactis]|uniref:Transcriptional regulator n=1 Tax=Epilithonimonas lactis TaxID=421072 RepID=A0A085BMS1_9FLAO|nr:response regulator transcription factor [Epilithonimonas lactis]KFC23766.1 transcriptional regulator [Epilithonimonas lactis]SEQ24575.1 DNA-binding response regulator, NarL/FixJ family, contains REC and HTH domains [Epilithonimonas lactis]
MFNKILIAEDHESSNFSVQKILEELNVPDVNHVYYCDDAFSQIKKSLDATPYEVLITDLSFEEDHRKQFIKNGRELIKCCKDLDPELKVIVFSGEHRLGVIDLLFSELKINAFVRKARSDAKELKKAIEAVYNGETYISHDLKLPVKSMNTLEFSNYDIILLQLLSEGVLQKNIPQILQEREIHPNSLSSVEKRMNAMKLALTVKNNEQLIAYCKDLGII